VWELADHRYRVIEQQPEATYRDPDGNEIGFGGALFDRN
jgi:hypothetical protein